MSIYPFYDNKTGLTFLGGTSPQGDLDWIPIESIPKNAIKKEPEDGHYILAHSETGHHHVLDRVNNINYYQCANDPFSGYLEVIENPVELKHLRSFDTHAPQTIPPGKYYVPRGREYTPQGFRRTID